jgi:hypothetical protein
MQGPDEPRQLERSTLTLPGARNARRLTWNRQRHRFVIGNCATGE